MPISGEATLSMASQTAGLGHEPSGPGADRASSWPTRRCYYVFVKLKRPFNRPIKRSVERVDFDTTHCYLVVYDH
jgi:hypothetical protein